LGIVKSQGTGRGRAKHALLLSSIGSHCSTFQLFDCRFANTYLHNFQSLPNAYLVQYDHLVTMV